jgi:excisionase family DNA binding protein
MVSPMTNTSAPPVLIGPQEAARRLGVSRTTLIRWEAAGLLRAIRTPTGQRRYRVDHIDELSAGRAAS